MSEEPTRSIPRLDQPAHGSLGPADPHADPATDPSLRLPEQHPGPSAVDEPTVSIPDGREQLPAGVTRTRTGGLWTGLILSAVVLIFLLVFILQNNVPVQINFLGFTGTLPTGVALLLAAIAGLLLVAIPGGLRIMQLRRVARRAAKR